MKKVLFFTISFLLSVQPSYATEKLSIFKNYRINAVYDIPEKKRVRRAYSILKTTEEEICVTTVSTNLPVGAYTSWWQIHNIPTACVVPEDFGNGQCGLRETRNPDVDGTVMWASGFIVGPDGKAHVNACVGVGELTHFVLRGNGLGDPFQAEIQHILRYHGPAKVEDATALGQQINDLRGGCQTDTQEGFPCFDAQVAWHPVKVGYYR